jgi:predicted HD phosphohydrolase
MQGENGAVSVSISISDMRYVLASGADVAVGPHTQLAHALQTAAVLRSWFPDDEELQVAGLVHDVGFMLPGTSDADHATAGAEAVREALGERVAALVGLHVDAKRYLVAIDPAYGEVLASDSVVSLERQGGPMSSDEAAVFEGSPFAADALILRRADESGKVQGLEVRGLAEWLPVLQRVHRHAG